MVFVKPDQLVESPEKRMKNEDDDEKRPKKQAIEQNNETKAKNEKIEKYKMKTQFVE
uniref:Uncharacterized protein n=1 Tax=Tetranychus urticae TaxID=32264 RepID=T1KT13_TETUR